MSFWSQYSPTDDRLPSQDMAGTLLDEHITPMIDNGYPAEPLPPLPSAAPNEPVEIMFTETEVDYIEHVVYHEPLTGGSTWEPTPHKYY